MLLRLSLENWMSFRDPISFSMIASQERQHGHRLAKVDKYQMRVLPIAAIYGGNASGKTNFFKALSFAKNLIVKGTQPDGIINVEIFQLDDSHKIDKPTRFSFELLINEVIYEFSFSLTRNAILDEKLVQVSSYSEKTLYHRKDGKPNFDASIENDQSLHFAFKGTRDNQLFLTNSVSQRIDAFRPIYDWFKNTLELLAPDSRFSSFEHYLDEEHPLFASMNTMLTQLDTGITHLGSETLIFESVPLPESLKSKLREELSEGTTVLLLNSLRNERFVITRKNGELIIKKLITYHRNADGSEVKFEMRQESDGSQRVIDLLPAFVELSAADSKRVYIIDELDRSLHTLLTRHLLEHFLSTSSPESRSQLIFTTHDALIMDQKLLRRDEMWVAERGPFGLSSLTPFSDFKDVRYDKDIRKSYLQGRLGGIPNLSLSTPNHSEEDIRQQKI
ncbi:MAG: ATP/GTP-binding protein [Chlamydiales bacterium]